MGDVRRLTISTIKNDSFRRFIYRSSRALGISPDFEFLVYSADSLLFRRWGTIPLRSHPDEYFSNLDAFFVLQGLLYHSVMPGTEINRLIVLLALQRVFDNLDETTKSFLLALFSISYALLHSPDSIRETLVNLLKTISISPIASHLDRFFFEILGHVSDGNSHDSLDPILIDILTSDLPLYNKAKLFFVTIRKKLDSTTLFISRRLKRLIIPISPKMEYSNKNFLPTPADLEFLAEIDYRFARSIAENLDRVADTKKIKVAEFSSEESYLPKLLERRRYLAAVRRSRIRQILSMIESKLLNTSPSRSFYGTGIWTLLDDTESLDLELSAEVFGRILPNFTTLRRIYDRQGDKPGDYFGHLELCLDTSGSMAGSSIDLGVEIAIALVEIAKRKGLSVGLTTFSSGAWEGLPPSRSYESIEEILLRIDADGGTNIRHALDIVYSHISKVQQNSLIAIITDSVISDIDYPHVLQQLSLLTSKNKLVFFIIGELWDRAISAINVSNDIKIFQIDPKSSDSYSIKFIDDIVGKGFQDATKIFAL